MLNYLYLHQNHKNFILAVGVAVQILGEQRRKRASFRNQLITMVCSRWGILAFSETSSFFKCLIVLEKMLLSESSRGEIECFFT